MARRPSDRRVADEVARLVTSLVGEQAAHIERAAVAVKLAAAAERLARAEVVAARELDGASWRDVGNALGVTRQTAHERYRSGPDGPRSRLGRPAG